MNNTPGNFFGPKIDVSELATGTQGQIIYYGASGTPAALNAGTSGQFLKTQGAGANPVWSNVGTMVFLGSASLGSAASTLTLSGLTTSAYKFLIIHVIEKSDSSATNHTTRMIFNADSGANYAHTISTDAGAVSSSTGDTALTIMPSTDNSDWSFFEGKLRNEAATKKIMIGQSCSNVDATLQLGQSSLRWDNTANTLTSINITKAENFAIGTSIYVWGLADS